MFIYSTSTIEESVVETVSPMFIIEDTVGYVPLHAGIGLETERITIIP